MFVTLFLETFFPRRLTSSYYPAMGFVGAFRFTLLYSSSGGEFPGVGLSPSCLGELDMEFHFIVSGVDGNGVVG